jgi:hypothetical protein
MQKIDDIPDMESVGISTILHQQSVEREIAALKVRLERDDKLNDVDRHESKVADDIGIKPDRCIGIPVDGHVLDDANTGVKHCVFALKCQDSHTAITPAALIVISSKTLMLHSKCDC